MALEAQNNPFTSILMVEAADPEALSGDADPAVGQRRLVVGADHLLYLLDDSGVATLVGAAAVTRASLGLATTDSPEFAALNVGHASDTTLARTAAGELAVEGNRIFRVGGADVPIADGGTGASSASAARTALGLVLGTDVASLTAGVVPIAQLATGTPTGSKFIRDDGTLQVPAGVGGGAGLVLLEEHAASAVALLDFTAWYSSTYDHYRIEFEDVKPATNSVSLVMRYSTDAGSSFVATGYIWNHLFTYGTASSGIEGSASDTSIAVSGGAVASAGIGVWGSATLIRPGRAGTNIKTVETDVTRDHTSVGFVHDRGRGYLSVAPVNALRFLFSSGNITSGTIRIYGIAKS